MYRLKTIEVVNGHHEGSISVGSDMQNSVIPYL